MTASERSIGDGLPLVLFTNGADALGESQVTGAVKSACWQNKLNFRQRRFSTCNVLDVFGRTVCLVADTTGNDAFVTHDIGIAHALEVPVVCLRHSEDEDLLADLQGIRFIYYGDLNNPEYRQHLTSSLTRRLNKILRTETREIIDSFLRRTEQIIEDFKTLLLRPDLQEQVLFYSGVLSPLAVNEAGLEPGELPFKDLLIEEKSLMIQLAERGCRVICIISPPSAQSILASGDNVVQTRLRCLIDFIEQHKQAACIDWVWSRYRQKTCYLVGDVSCIERFKKQVDQGVDLTLRQTSDAVIRAHQTTCQTIFQRLAGEVFVGYKHDSNVAREARRRDTVARLKALLKACRQPKRRKEHL